jgi:SAM-dependent methyltransferase
MSKHDPRDLEWQRRYEAQDTPWDEGAPAPPLLRFLENRPISGRVLVPGCGKGHEVLALGKREGCTAVGLDLSPAAVAEAKRLAAQAGLESKVSFVTGNFFEVSPKMKGTFDWVVEHTCFCAIEPEQRRDYVRGAVAALRPGGKLFGIFYLTPAREVGPPFPVSKEELNDLFAADFTLIEEWVPEVSFPGRENREWVRILQKR